MRKTLSKLVDCSFAKRIGSLEVCFWSHELVTEIRLGFFQLDNKCTKEGLHLLQVGARQFSGPGRHTGPFCHLFLDLGVVEMSQTFQTAAAGAGQPTTGTGSSLQDASNSKKQTDLGPFSAFLVEARARGKLRQLNLPPRFEVLKPVVQAMMLERPHFIPMTSQLVFLRAFVNLQKCLHGQAAGPHGMLLTGPYGCGKTCILGLLANDKVVEAMDSVNFSGQSTERRTLRLNISLYQGLRSFHVLILRRIAFLVSKHRNEADPLLLILEKLRELRMISPKPTEEDLQDAGLKPCGPEPGSSDSRAFFKQLPVEYQTALMGVPISFMAVLNAVLRVACIAVVVCIDDAERLFFSEGSPTGLHDAHSTVTDILSILHVQDSAIGLIICSGHPRAHQLFLPDLKTREFVRCPEQSGLEHLAKRFEKSGLVHVLMPRPVWNTETLIAFVLIYALGGEVVQSQLLGETCAARANGLDLELWQSLNGFEQAGSTPLLAGALEQVLCHHKHSMLEFVRFVDALRSPWQKFLAGKEYWSWLRERELQWLRERANFAFTAYSSVLCRTKGGFDKESLSRLGYDVTKYKVLVSDVVEQLCGSFLSETSSGGSADSRQGSAKADDVFHKAVTFAKSCVDAALDSGLLSYLGAGHISMAHAWVRYEFVCQGLLVDPKIVSSIQFRRWSDEVILCMARALARSRMLPPNDASTRWELDAKVCSDVVAEIPSGTDENENFIKVSNDDGRSGAVAYVHTFPLSPVSLTPMQPAKVQEQDITNLPYQLQQAVLKQLSDMQVGVHDASSTQLWCALVAAGRGLKFSQRALAALLALKRMNPRSAEALGKNNGCIWLREPDSAQGSGQLVAIARRMHQGQLQIRIQRVHVLMASQDALAQGPDCDECRCSIQEMLEQVLGSKDVALTTCVAGASLHELNCRALGDVVLTAILHQFDSDFDKLGQMFNRLLPNFEVDVQFCPPAIATTFTVASHMTQAVQAAGVTLLDGQDLREHWGPLGVVCESLGVLLASAS